MGKRSNFNRVPRDFYPTPKEAVLPLLKHLPDGTNFTEPCVGDGDLVAHLEEYGHRCSLSYDIEKDATVCQDFAGDLFITNPPWDRKILHPIIRNLIAIAPAWLLFDADWMHTKQARPFLPNLSKIVSIGRVKWIPDSKMTGKDNCCWYLFEKDPPQFPIFVGRQADE